jgi:hypothetical protein
MESFTRDKAVILPMPGCIQLFLKRTLGIDSLPGSLAVRLKARGKSRNEIVC